MKSSHAVIGVILVLVLVEVALTIVRASRPQSAVVCIVRDVSPKNPAIVLDLGHGRTKPERAKLDATCVTRVVR